jgi:IS605 OrfB family transposase
MQLTVTVKLSTPSAQHAALVQTLRTCNAACDDISATAFATGTFRQYDLHGLVYHPVKAQTNLNANHVVRAIAKVAHAYQLDTRVQRTFAPLGAIELDKDLLTWKVDVQTVSLNSVAGRLHLPFLCSVEQKALLQGKKGQTDLLLRDGAFYLSCAVTVAEAEPFTPEGVIGIDLGIVNVATDSEGNQYTGEAVKRVRKRYRRLRQELQAKKTRSARKRMAKSRQKESRFVRDVNHCISKTLVGMAIHRKKALALEMLQGIRERGNRLNRAMRTELNNWAFAQLKFFLAYKCTRAGVPLIEVDARYSSQQCSRCGHTERANRPSQEVFCCRYCCFQANADVNGAMVLEARVTLSTGPRFYLAARASRGGQAVRL